jgi:hypothetical protein
MQIDISTIDRENFMVHPHIVNGENCWLVQPIHIGAKWTRHTMIFRSSLWSEAGELISAGYKKFFNWDEQPDLDPIPSDLSGASLMEKLDGSTLIVSRRKGFTIWRTRGTSNAREQDNGHEIDLLMQKYPRFMEYLERIETSRFSYIFEWLSPTNRIVIDYGPEVDMVLTNIVRHEDYSYYTQKELDVFAISAELRRPNRYSYNSVEEMKKSVEAFAGKEGLCVYFDHDQRIRKVKGAQYLYLHRAKSEVSSFEKVLDVYLGESEKAGHYLAYMDFFNFLVDTFDYEIATIAQPHVSVIADAIKDVEKLLAAMKSFVEPLKSKTRKEAALTIIQAYGNTNRSGMAFKLLDGKMLDKDDTKKLVYQVTKA